jgi:hypothetical protein
MELQRGRGISVGCSGRPGSCTPLIDPRFLPFGTYSKNLNTHELVQYRLWACAHDVASLQDLAGMGKIDLVALLVNLGHFSEVYTSLS